MQLANQRRHPVDDDGDSADSSDDPGEPAQRLERQTHATKAGELGHVRHAPVDAARGRGDRPDLANEDCLEMISCNSHGRPSRREEKLLRGRLDSWERSRTRSRNARRRLSGDRCERLAERVCEVITNRVQPGWISKPRSRARGDANRRRSFGHGVVLSAVKAVSVAYLCSTAISSGSRPDASPICHWVPAPVVDVLSEHQAAPARCRAGRKAGQFTGPYESAPTLMGISLLPCMLPGATARAAQPAYGIAGGFTVERSRVWRGENAIKRALILAKPASKRSPSVGRPVLDAPKEGLIDQVLLHLNAIDIERLWFVPAFVPPPGDLEGIPPQAVEDHLVSRMKISVL